MAVSRFSQTEVDQQKAVLAGPHRYDAASGKYVTTGDAPKVSAAAGNDQAAILAGPHHWEPGQGSDPGRYVRDVAPTEPERPQAKPAKK